MAAHLRHIAFVSVCWWWLPPVMFKRMGDHAKMVNRLYDELTKD